MKTSYFKNFSGPGAISIARRAPRGFLGPSYPKLAPGRWFASVSPERYAELYRDEILSLLDPEVVWDELSALAGGVEPTLLCWEKPPKSGDLFCHRRMAAEWLEKTRGVVVSEMDPPNPVRSRIKPVGPRLF